MIATLEASETRLQSVGFSSLRNWASDDHRAALETFRRSCAEIVDTGHGFRRPARYAGKRDDWLDVCQNAATATDPRSFFEAQFQPFQVDDTNRPGGLLTGYFEPEAEGSLTADSEFMVPIYARPSDLVAFDANVETMVGVKYGHVRNGKPAPYWTRQEIEQGALQGRGLELAWLKRWDDAFFMHIQGSGRIKLQDGRILRLSYAAKTGLPYTAIGGVLIDRGILTRETNSMQAIRFWMNANPQAARELMWQNKSYVFFRKVDVTDPSLGALGAQQVHLTPERSLAVDRSLWSFGTPIWIESHKPLESPGGAVPYNRLLVAQDTGSAIKGHGRGDVYWGWGETAARIAGHMKSPARFVVLLPKRVAAKLDLAP